MELEKDEFSKIQIYDFKISDFQNLLFRFSKKLKCSFELFGRQMQKIQKVVQISKMLSLVSR